MTEPALSPKGHAHAICMFCKDSPRFGPTLCNTIGVKISLITLADAANVEPLEVGIVDGIQLFGSKCLTDSISDNPPTPPTMYAAVPFAIVFITAYRALLTKCWLANERV
jgi:hypothetical protein